MSEAEILHPSELSSGDCAAWSALQARTPSFSSPLLGPDFARAVGALRDDARVAVWRDSRRGAWAFFPHHRRPTRFGRPIGSPLSDYHALVSAPDPGLDSREVLRSARLSAFRFSGLVDPFGVFAGASRTSLDARRISAAATGQAKDALPSGGNALRNFRRYSRKIARDLGPLRLTADLDQGGFERLLGWKQQQLQRTGLHDFLRPGWTRALLQQLFETRGAPFAGLMLSLHAGERHLAGHFGVRLGGHYHPWIGAMDPELEAYAPGFVHQWSAIAAMPQFGLQTYDLGPGSPHWKSSFATDAMTLEAGLATGPGLGGRLAGVSEGVWGLAPLDRNGLAGRLRSRLDQIAAMELSLGGRVRGVLAAAAGLERRTASRRKAAEA